VSSTGRRRFLQVSGGAWLGCLMPTACLGQSGLPSVKKRFVRMTTPTNDPNANDAARKSWAAMLASHGLIDGRDVVIEIIRPRTLQLDQNPEYDAIVRKVLAPPPDVILVHMTWLPHVARFTRDIPIVFSGMIEPEAQGYIDSARRPGRNITGALYPLFELQAKRIGFAKEMMPNARRAAVVCDPGGLELVLGERIKATARNLGMEGFVLALGGNKEKGVVTEALRDYRIDIADFITHVHPDTRPDMLRLGIAGTAGGVESGGSDGILLSYNAIGVDEVAAALAARILKGEKVATLPAQEPQEFEMTINLRTARALGVTVPPSLLVGATTVFR
jgi:putative ABC transport system substrate-binding protein